MGVIGMSLDDAYRLTIPDFEAIYEQYVIRETAQHRTAWEQARFISHCAMYPHMKRGFRLEDVAVFDWEKKETKRASKRCTQKEFEQLKKKYSAT